MKIKHLLNPLHRLFVASTGVIYWEHGMKVTTDGWVILYDGNTRDALPINLVSQEIIDKVEKNLTSWGYAE